MHSSSDVADAASKLKTVKNVFKRRSKNDMASAIHEHPDAEERGTGKGEEDTGYNSDTES